MELRSERPFEAAEINSNQSDKSDVGSEDPSSRYASLLATTITPLSLSALGLRVCRVYLKEAVPKNATLR
jgi:hypothetical protein